jgi:hypothetical protein
LGTGQESQREVAVGICFLLTLQLQEPKAVPWIDQFSNSQYDGLVNHKIEFSVI